MTYAPYYGYVENPILDQIELSVRAGRVLRDSGLVQTLDDFMALTEAKVRPLKGAGAKTWREIKEIQESIGRDTAQCLTAPCGASRGVGGMTDIVEQLKYGLIERRKRWSGDTHSDLGGSVDYEANGKLMNEAAAEITRLREKVAKADALAEVAERAIRLSQEHDDFKLYAMEPMWQALAAYREADT